MFPVQSDITRNAPEHEQTVRFPWLDATADLNKPHWPDISDGKTYVPYTEIHLQMELQHNLKGCAAFLWKWILLQAPAGCAVNLNWKDFQAFSGEHKDKPYSMKQISRAVTKLTELGFLEVVEANMKVIGRHPGKVSNDRPRTKMSNSGTKMSNSGTKMSNSGTKMSNVTVETLTEAGFQEPSNYSNTLKAAKQEPAAAQKVFQEEETAGQTRDEAAESGQQEISSQEEGTGQPSELTHKGKCSAVQLEALKKMGIVVSRALESRLNNTDAATIDKAIAVFQQDKATWEGSPMKNPAGYFQTVLKDVAEGRREPAPGLQHQAMAADPIEEMLLLWRSRWEKMPHLHEQFRREIADAYPRGEIVVFDDEVGPVRGMTR